MGSLIVLLLQVTLLVFIARVVFSWIRPGDDSPFAPIARTVDAVTEPVVAPIRRRLPRTGPFDFSVLIVVVAISFVLIPIASRL